MHFRLIISGRKPKGYQNNDLGKVVGTVQQGGSLFILDGLESIQNGVLVDPTLVEGESKPFQIPAAHVEISQRKSTFRV